MKNKIYYSRLFITIGCLSIPSLSETDSFDMSLSGVFKKDYCEISHVIISRKNITSSQLHDQIRDINNSEKIYRLAEDSYEIFCSDGFYDIAIYSDSPQFVEIPEINLTLTTSIFHTAPTGKFLYGEGTTELYSGHHSRVYDVEFDETSDGIPHQILLTTNAVPTDGKFANVKDGTFSHTYNHTIVIDANNELR